MPETNFKTGGKGNDEENGKLGITWNKEFKPFSLFAPSVRFENVMTGKKYHFSNITERLERI